MLPGIHGNWINMNWLEFPLMKLKYVLLTVNERLKKMDSHLKNSAK